MKNILSKDKRPIIQYNQDGSVRRITDQADGGKGKVLYEVTDGTPRRTFAPGITRFDISPEEDLYFKRKAKKITSDRKPYVQLARELKMPNWSFDLENYGVIILEGGELLISYWYTNEDKKREKKWRNVKNLGKAIRQQDHIVEKYLAKEGSLAYDPDPAPEFYGLLRKISVVRPYIEMRREQLVHAQRQMDWCVNQVIRGLGRMLKAKGNNRENCHGLPEKLKRMTFFLRNKWPALSGKNLPGNTANY